MQPLIIVLVVLVLIPMVWFIATFNRFVALRQHLRESWADIDVELKRRYDLIPNLVQVVQGYAVHERQTLEELARLRATAAANTGAIPSQAADEELMCLGLQHVFVVAENYPALRADRQFLALQQQLAETEDRIAAARRFYNANVRDLNRLREQFPSNLVAGTAKVGPAGYFELSDAAERVVPTLAMTATRLLGNCSRRRFRSRTLAL